MSCLDLPRSRRLDIYMGEIQGGSQQRPFAEDWIGCFACPVQAWPVLYWHLSSSRSGSPAPFKPHDAVAISLSSRGRDVARVSMQAPSRGSCTFPLNHPTQVSVGPRSTSGKSRETEHEKTCRCKTIISLLHAAAEPVKTAECPESCSLDLFLR